MNLQDELNIPLDDFEYEELESFLLMLESPEALLNMSEFDGFITALVSGPDAVPPGEWLPLVWGGDAQAAGLESPEDVERIGRLMIRHLNTTALTLAEDPEAFEPWFMENEVDGRVFLVVDDWCIGYMKAVMLRPNAWGLDDPAMVELMAPIPLFTSNEGWDLLEQLADRHIEYLQNEVLPAARALHEHWLGRRDALSPPEGARLH